MRTTLFPALFLTIFAFSYLSPAYALEFDFSDKAQLGQWEVVQGNWEIADGNLVFTEAAGGPRQQERLELTDVTFSDGTVEWKMNWMDGTNWEAGLFYRLQDDGNWYMIHIGAGAGDLRLLGMAGNSIIRPYPTAKIDAKKGEWHTFRVEVSGNKHEVFVDGNLLIEHEDDTFKEGKIAFGSWSAEAETTHFDDVKITGKGIVASVIRLPEMLTTTWSRIKLLD